MEKLAYFLHIKERLKFFLGYADIKSVNLTKARFFMPAMSVGGLVSGLDTNSIIAQLTALEQAKVTREMQKKDNAQKTLDKFKELQTRLGNLAQKASSLETPDKFNVFKALSNYEDYAVVSGKEGATAGNYELEVKQLATTQKVASKKIDSIITPLVDSADLTDVFGGDETITLNLSKSAAAIKANPTKTTVDVVITKSDTLKDIVNKINAAEGTGVKASIMTMADGDNRLVLTAVDTGTKGFSITQEPAGTQKLMEYLGVLSGDNGDAVSGNALIVGHGLNKGEVATGATPFADIDTALNTIDPVNDALGIRLQDGSWMTFGLSTYATIDDMLTDIGTALGATASIKNGEIVLSGSSLGDMSGVKIQIGRLGSGNPGDTFASADSIFADVKKDMGTFATRNKFANEINAGQNAIYSIDGMWVNSQSNSDDKTISGSVFTLKKVSQPGMEKIKVSLELDMDSLANKINEFVEEYNALIKFIDENAKASVKEETNKDTGKKTNTREVGAFTGDTNISSLRENLRQMMTGTIDALTGTLNNGYSTAYSSAARIGITTQKDGSISVDKDKLTKALNADFEGVRRLFTANSFSDTPGFSVGNFNKNSTTGVYHINADPLGVGDVVTLNGESISGIKRTANIITLPNGISFEVPPDGGSAKVTFVRGIASQLSNFVEKAKNSVDGYFKQSEKTYQARIDSIQKRVDELQIRVDNYSARITKQFSSLERSMANLQSQTANMMAALSTSR